MGQCSSSAPACTYLGTHSPNGLGASFVVPYEANPDIAGTSNYIYESPPPMLVTCAEHRVRRLGNSLLLLRPFTTGFG